MPAAGILRAPSRRIGTAIVKALVACVVAIWAPSRGFAQAEHPATGQRARTSVAAGAPTTEIRIDGVFDEPGWADAPVAADFRQRRPVEGQPAEHPTEVRVIVGPDAVYVAARMHDPEPETISRRLTRRDESGQFDYFELSLDPNRDLRTGYWFVVSAANVQRDGYLFDDVSVDVGWDAVWTSAVTVDEGGWNAEIRIPLSQIRYEAEPDPQTWGVNFARNRVRSNELSEFSVRSQTRRGRTSQFGLLTGVVLTEATGRLEIVPYVLGSAVTGPSDLGNPFFDGREVESRIGVDVSYGIGAAFTLDATIGPDFGQVDADPAVVNLGAFEVTQPEQRPFFAGGAKLFAFPLSGSNNEVFYSRRIGRLPQRTAPDSAQFSRVPDAAMILGAARLVGRTADGLSLGVLTALTDKEIGRFATGDDVEEFVAEPMTAYGVVRAAQDLREGETRIGVIGTAVRRFLPDDGSLDFLTTSALAGGVDFEHQWSDRAWSLTGSFAYGHVSGDSTALTRVQRNSNHYFQRPDATRLSVDSTRTAMGGAEWRLELERQRGRLIGSAWVGEVTPEFEINDLGRTNAAERLDAGFRIAYRVTVPGQTLRSWRVELETTNNWMHEALDDGWRWASWRRAVIARTYSLSGEIELLNYWKLNPELRYRPPKVSRTATRGGPLIADPETVGADLRLRTDERRLFSLDASLGLMRGRSGVGDEFTASLGFELRPGRQWYVEVTPDFATKTDGRQPVGDTDVVPFGPTFGRRYLFGSIKRTSLGLDTRINWILTNRLSLEAFVQPLITAVDYRVYKQLEAPRTFDFDVFEPGVLDETGSAPVCRGGRICRKGDDQLVDFDGDGVIDYTFVDADFNERSLLSNVVIRWEFRPGSTAFLVWQHRQIERVAEGDFNLWRDVSGLFRAPSEDTFTLKIEYRFGR